MIPAGILLAYCGRAVKDESPLLLFPNGFDPRIAIFNANRIVEGDLFLVRDPLQVLTAHESGIENVVAFLTENVTALQLEQLAALMDERKCEHLEMFLSPRKRAHLLCSVSQRRQRGQAASREECGF